MPSEHPFRLRGEADIRDEEDEERDQGRRTTGWSNDTIAVENERSRTLELAWPFCIYSNSKLF
jgi:hypothetical protein